MKLKYIQLPPLPLDAPKELIEMIWVYARLPKDEQKTLLDFIQNEVENSNENSEKIEPSDVVKRGEVEASSDLEEYTNLMRKMIAGLIAQACENAALVYWNYCVEKKSIEEISEEYGVEAEFIELMARYYEERMEL